MGEIVFLLISAVLIVVCGLFVAAEFALITVDRATVKRHAGAGDKSAQGVELALKSLSTQLSGAQVGITITNLAIGYLAQPSLTKLLSEPLKAAGVQGAAVSGISVVMALLLATAATMIFGELIPKNLAIALPLETAKSIQQFQRTFSWVMTYPIRICNGTANAILRKMNVEPREELASARSAEELSSLVRRSADKGTLPKEMALMLERSLAFGERRADEVMTPRSRVESLRATDFAEAVIQKAKDTGYSRFPVTGKNIDDVIGIVHVKHAVGVPRKSRRSTQVKDIMRDPVLVPSNLQLDPLMEMLRNGGLQMAVIIDEFGGTDGIVTVEDLIEELVGEVRDEHDQASVLAQKIKPGVWILPGLFRPDEASQFIGVAFPEEDEFETLGGLISERLERVPELLDVVDITVVDRDGQEQAMRLKVTEMDGHRVEKIRVSIESQSHGAVHG
jgi:CBS domain containing-hemolysin-like protein